MIFYCPPEGERIEFAGNNQRSSSQERCQRGRDQTVDVEEWHHTERDIVRRERVGIRDVGARNRKVDVFERNAFGPSSTAAGMQDECDIVRRGPSN